VQDDFEPQTSLAKELKTGFRSAKHLEAKEMIDMMKRLETEQQERPKIKIKAKRLTQN
jgi:hypothetical protein